MSLLVSLNSNFFQKIILLIIFTFLFTIYIYWTWSDVLGTFGGDNAWYILSAKYLSPYNSYSSTTEFFALHSPYPIMVPLIIAITGGAENIEIAHLTTTIFLLLSFVILFYWMRKLGFSIWISIFTTIVFASLPITYIHALEILSENYFIFFCLLSIICSEIPEQKDNYICYITLAALAAGLAILVRNAGISLIVAFICYTFLHYSIRKSIRLTIICLSPLILSFLFSYKVPGQHSYLEWLINEYQQMSNFSKIVQHHLEHVVNFVHGWFSIFSANNLSEKIVFSFVGLICFLGMIKRLINKKLDALFSTAYLLLLLAWPFSYEAQRYLYPVIPILLVQGLFLINQLNSRSISYLSSAFLIVLFIANVPTLAWTIQRHFEPIPEKYENYRHSAMWYHKNLETALSSVYFTEQLTNDMKIVNQILNNDECVFSIKPSILSLYSDRISHSPPLESLNEKEFMQEVRLKKCNYFFTFPRQSITYSEPYYPANRIQNNADVISIGMSNNTEATSILLKMRE